MKPLEEFAARVEAFKGRFLCATNCTRLLADYAAAPEVGSAGLTFSARKDEDLTGVKLSICLLPGPLPQQNKSCHVEEGVVLGGRSLYGNGGVGDWSFYAHDDRAW